MPETKGQEAADIDDMEEELERIVARDKSLEVAEKSNFNMTCTDFRKDTDEKEVINTVVKSSTVDDFRKNDNSKHVPYILQPEVEPQIEEFESRNLVPEGVKLSSGAQEPLKDIAEKIMVKKKKRVKPMKKKDEGPAEFDPRKFNAYG